MGDAARQALSIVLDHRVRAFDGSQINLTAQTICLHSDTPGAGGFARRVVVQRGNVIGQKRAKSRANDPKCGSNCSGRFVRFDQNLPQPHFGMLVLHLDTNDPIVVQGRWLFRHRWHYAIL